MTPHTILVVVAHPDDAELTCAGSIARWVRDGARAVLVVATDGARGAKYESNRNGEIALQRHEEQRRAADMIGFDEVVRLDFPDGELQDDLKLRGALVQQIRSVRPDTAVVMDPSTVIYQNSYVNHRDHRMLGISMLDALYPQASNSGFFPEQLSNGLNIHKVPELLLTQSEAPNHWIDVTDTLELRFSALRCHESQIRLWPENGEAVIRQQRQQAAELGKEHGMHFAEAFRRVIVNPLT